MGLADDLANVNIQRCSFGRWLDQADDTDRTAVLDYIEQIREKRLLNPRGQGPSIQKLVDTLNSNGVALGVRVTQIHVNGSCRCET